MHTNERILSIKELNRYIKMKLESDALLQDVWIRGEISNFTHHASGHMYFTLKDKDSRIKSIMFAVHNQKLPFIPREGAMVLARGNISIFERDGQYQFYVQEMQPDGIGGLFLAFEQLKKKLEAEGLFAKETKKTLPRLPRTIGVITSPTGAAVRDIMITLQRRFPSIPVLLFPVLVQGTQAAPSIVKAILAMNELTEIDVLIVGRGGGSMEELWAFNEEIVARAIYASNIPIISAVGHETDFTIADFVADLRAATPTAAAELAVPHHLELKQQLNYFIQRIHQGLGSQLNRKKEKLSRIARSAVLTNPRRQLQQPLQRLDRLTEQLAYKIQTKLSKASEKTAKLDRILHGFNPKNRIVVAHNKIKSSRHLLFQSIQAWQKDHRQQLSGRMQQLDALSPLKVMQRGYSLVYDEKKIAIINSIQSVQLGDLIQVTMTDGQLDCQVWSMTGGEENGRQKD